MKTIETLKSNMLGAAIGGVAGFYLSKRFTSKFTLRLVATAAGLVVGAMVQNKMKPTKEKKSSAAGEFYGRKTKKCCPPGTTMEGGNYCRTSSGALVPANDCLR